VALVTDTGVYETVPYTWWESIVWIGTVAFRI